MSGAYDVIVAGLGAMGSATLHQLARRGRRVLGLDRFAPTHALQDNSPTANVVAMYETARKWGTY